MSGLPTDEALNPTMSVEETKYLGGDLEHTHLVKGLDYALLQKVSTNMLCYELRIHVHVLIMTYAGTGCRSKWSRQTSRKRKHRTPSSQGAKPRQNRSLHASTVYRQLVFCSIHSHTKTYSHP